jgi:hypothetical protein
MPESGPRHQNDPRKTAWCTASSCGASAIPNSPSVQQITELCSLASARLWCTAERGRIKSPLLYH